MTKKVSEFQVRLTSVGSRMTVLLVILAWFRPGSRSLKQLQVTSCELNKKMVVRYRFSEQSFKTYQAFWMMILGPPLREDGHEVAEGVCFKEEHGEHEMRREYEKQERVLVFS